MKFLATLMILVSVFSCSQVEKKEISNNSVENHRLNEHGEIIVFSKKVFESIKDISSDSLEFFVFKDIKKRNFKNYNPYDKSIMQLGSQYELYNNLRQIPTIIENWNNLYKFYSEDFSWGNMAFRKSTCEDYSDYIRIAGCHRSDSYEKRDEIRKNKTDKYFLVTIYFTDELTKCEYFIEIIVKKYDSKIELVPCNQPKITKIRS